MFTKNEKFDFVERERLIEDYIIREFLGNEKIRIKVLSERLGWPVETIRKYVRNLIKKQEIKMENIFYSLTTKGEERANSIRWKKAKREKNVIIIEDGKKLLNLLAIIPEYYSGNRVYLESDEELIRIWYKSSNRGNSPNPFISKRLIPMDDNLWISLGLIYGDGRTSMSEKCSFTFTNKEPELVKFILNFLQSFGIERNRVYWHVNLNPARVSYPNYVKICEKYWQYSCDLKNEKMRKIVWNINVKAKYGIVQISCFNSSFRLIIQTLVENMQKYAEVIREFSTPYLKGLIATEGSVILKKGGSLDNVNMANISQNGMRHFSSCLRCIGIDSIIKNEEGGVKIYGWHNFVKIKINNLTSLHPEKREKFESGFFNSSKTKKLYNIYLMKNKGLLAN